MHTKLVEKEIKYTGKELAPHWIYKSFNLKGDAIVAFIGEVEVKLTEMVDIQDVIENSPIYSKKMINLIVEHFGMPLTEGVARQRLLINIIREVLLKYLEKGSIIERDGDDLFFEGGKLSVSIATKSMTSVLIHVGINIESEGAPIKVSAIKSEMDLDNIEQIASDIINNYKKENEEIIQASCKVRGVI